MTQFNMCDIIRAALISAIVVTVSGERKFPPGFKFGAATAAYQVEGAWNVSDKSPSIWDVFAHEHPEYFANGTNGDVACDSYHRWPSDVVLAKGIGLHFYRFSISWPRLLPTGFSNVVSEDGSRYYNNLIDALLANGIEPVITLYHWDLPQSLQDLGGWTNRDIAIWFEDYARVAYTLFGDRVKTWLTINEAIVICDESYINGEFAPKIKSPGIGNYLCARNIMLAHARAYRLYDREFRSKYNGKVGITNNHAWYEPNTPEDQDDTEFVRQLSDLYGYPIFSKTGGWPPRIENFIAKLSKQQGYERSRLPAFTQDEIELIKGSSDFYGLNYYTSRLVIQGNPKGERNTWFNFGYPELNLIFKPDPSWKAGHAWLYSYAPGLRRLLKWLKDQYGDLEFRIMENGYSYGDNVMFDIERIQYYEEHLSQLLLAIEEDGINVTAFTAWSLIDNFEWTSGYTSRFGLVSVNFTDPKRARTPRASALYYAAVIDNHSLDLPERLLSQRTFKILSNK